MLGLGSVESLTCRWESAAEQWRGRLVVGGRRLCGVVSGYCWWQRGGNSGTVVPTQGGNSRNDEHSNGRSRSRNKLGYFMCQRHAASPHLGPVY